MSDIGEAVGTAVEGGLFAKAVSGRGDSRAQPVPVERGHFAEEACLNCGTAINGAHCHECGQKVHLHRTVGAFFHDLMHGALHFDGKTWRTLPMLAFKPGKLTRRYIDGERARFVSPMALFLFSIFLMFAVFQFAGISAPTDLQGDTAGQVREFAAAERERVLESRERLTEQIAAAEPGSDERAQFEASLQEVEDQLVALEAAEQEIPFLQGLGDGAGDPPEPAVNEDGETVIPLDGDADGRANMTVGTSGVGWIDAALEKWRTNPGLMLYKLQTNFYKFSWLLIPLSVPFVWLMFFWKRRFNAYDHAIFVTYSLSFMTLLILVVTMLGLVGAPVPLIVFSLLLIPPIHIYKQLRGAYEISRFSAFWRLGVLTIFVVVILTLFLQALLLLGAF